MIKNIKYSKINVPKPPPRTNLTIPTSVISSKFNAIGISNKISKVNPACCR